MKHLHLPTTTLHEGDVIHDRKVLLDFFGRQSHVLEDVRFVDCVITLGNVFVKR